MVILGLLVATDSIIRHAASPEMAAEMRTFYATPLVGMLMFSTSIYIAFRNRFNPAAHKRLILIANLAIVEAALDRWPIPWHWWTNRMALLLMLYDWWSTKKIQPATLWGAAFLITMQQVVRPLVSHSAPFPSFAAWMQTHARSFL